MRGRFVQTCGGVWSGEEETVGWWGWEIPMVASAEREHREYTQVISGGDTVSNGGVGGDGQRDGDGWRGRWK